MNYDLMCFGKYKENNVRCSHCIDKGRCEVEKILKERECENEKDKNIKN